MEALSGVDIRKDPAPVHSGMARLLGGIDVTTQGETSVLGLYAAGECAGTGFHGAQAGRQLLLVS